MTTTCKYTERFHDDDISCIGQVVINDMFSGAGKTLTSMTAALLLSEFRRDSILKNHVAIRKLQRDEVDGDDVGYPEPPHIPGVVVFCPPKLVSSWTETAHLASGIANVNILVSSTVPKVGEGMSPVTTFIPVYIFSSALAGRNILFTDVVIVDEAHVADKHNVLINNVPPPICGRLVLVTSKLHLIPSMLSKRPKSCFLRRILMEDKGIMCTLAQTVYSTGERNSFAEEYMGLFAGIPCTEIRIGYCEGEDNDSKLHGAHFSTNLVDLKRTMHDKHDIEIMHCSNVHEIVDTLKKLSKTLADKLVVKKREIEEMMKRRYAPWMLDPDAARRKYVVDSREWMDPQDGEIVVDRQELRQLDTFLERLDMSAIFETETKEFARLHASTQRVLRNVEKKYTLVHRLCTQLGSLHETCPVCLDEMGDSGVSINKCWHAMCKVCLKALTVNQCPLCRDTFSEVAVVKTRRELGRVPMGDNFVEHLQQDALLGKSYVDTILSVVHAIRLFPEDKNTTNNSDCAFSASSSRRVLLLLPQSATEETILDLKQAFDEIGVPTTKVANGKRKRGGEDSCKRAIGSRGGEGGRSATASSSFLRVVFQSIDVVFDKPSKTIREPWFSAENTGEVRVLYVRHKHMHYLSGLDLSCTDTVISCAVNKELRDQLSAITKPSKGFLARKRLSLISLKACA
jgi:hypothetical protein